MKYKVGDKVRIKSIDWYNENKNTYGDILFNNACFVKRQSLYCGCELTIRLITDNSYYVFENEYYWTDEMIEGLVEYKKTIVNDMEKIAFKPHKTRGQEIIKILENMGGVNKFNLDGSRGILANETNYGNYIANDWDAFGLMRLGYKIYTLEEYEEEEKKETIVDYVKESNDRYRIVVDNRFDIEVDEGEYYAVRRKKEYPKTYEECLKVLGFNVTRKVKETPIFDYDDDIIALQKLKRCRDAYWKIAGEEMGLGKPWKPDYDSGVNKFGIICLNGVVQESNPTTNWERHLNKIFDFPTKEMRDAFKENFDKDLEFCKEFL
jgi:hypothetical protein